MPLVSIIIPTNRDETVLLPCLEAIARQRFDHAELEVLVVFNGVEPAPLPHCWPFLLVTDEIPEASITAAKNRALDLAGGDWVILINDDTRPEPDFVRTHLAVHARLNTPAMVLGRSNWVQYPDETVFDRMISDTSMIFFYDQMQPHEWYGFRHAWNLNLSLERHYCNEVRFEPALRPVNFDDIEWAYRMERRHDLRVWYAPEAVSLHDHRYTLESYLQREEHNGRMSVRLWRCNPDCFEAIFGCPLDDDFAAYCRQYVAQEGRRESEFFDTIRDFARRPYSRLAESDAARAELIPLLYQAHLPLKRLALRRGLAAELDAHGGPVHPARAARAPQPAGAPK